MMRTIRAGLTVLFDNQDFQEFVKQTPDGLVVEEPKRFPVVVSYSQTYHLDKIWLTCNYIYEIDLRATLHAIHEYLDE
jgi:hypothetical protein